jgi:DNA-binding NarL/FixJ family response regulator
MLLWVGAPRVGVGMTEALHGGGDAPAAGCTVLVLDSSPVFAEALAQSLTTSGVDSTYAEITEHVDVTSAGVVILDGDRPTAAIAAAGSMRRRGFEPRIVLLVKKSGGAQKRLLADIGAQGWLTRQASIDDVATAVRRVAAGKTVAPRGGVTTATAEELAIERLTQREQVIVQLIATGRGNGAIAEALGISANTVRTHVQNVMAKLGVGSRMAVVAVARRTALLDVAYAAEPDL